MFNFQVTCKMSSSGVQAVVKGVYKVLKAESIILGNEKAKFLGKYIVLILSFEICVHEFKGESFSQVMRFSLAAFSCGGYKHREDAQ